MEIVVNVRIPAIIAINNNELIDSFTDFTVYHIYSRGIISIIISHVLLNHSPIQFISKRLAVES